VRAKDLLQAMLTHQREPGVEELTIVAQSDEIVLCRDELGDLVARRGLALPPQVVETHPVRRADPPSQDERSVCDGREAETRQVFGPAVEGGRVFGGAAVQGRIPARRVHERYVARVMKRPDVARQVRDPRSQGIRPSLTFPHTPAPEDEREAAFSQVRRRLAHHLTGHRVTAEAAVPERDPALRRDHERWIRHDEVERLLGDRLEEASGATFDVLDAVQRTVEQGEIQRAGIHVARHDALRMARREDRLDPIAAPDVERALDGMANGQAREEHRGARDPHDMVGGEIRSALGRLIASDDEVTGWEQADRRLEPARRATHDAKVQRVLDGQGAERGARVSDRNGER
jgi:hypothetical protein